MDVGLKEQIIAVVTTEPNSISSGSVPVFYAKDEEERENIALLLSKTTQGMIHDLKNGCFIIVRH